MQQKLDQKAKESENQGILHYKYPSETPANHSTEHLRDENFCQEKNENFQQPY